MAAINTQETARVIGKPFKQGNPGKPLGAKNHLTKTVKETVLEVFNRLQNDPNASLEAWAKKKPGEFYQIAAKLIPTEITGTLVTAINIIETVAVGCKPLEENAN